MNPLTLRYAGRSLAILSVLAGGLACADDAPPIEATPVATPDARPTVAVLDTSIVATLRASALAEPYQRATLATRLMGAVEAVLVQVGDVVTAGQPLVRVDARELVARRDQVEAAIAAAGAARHEATLHWQRMRALYQDSAATRAQLDAAEAGLTRAVAGEAAARASASEVGAMADYAVVRAPFPGVITRRLVDPGDLAAPGTPLMEVEDQRRLRVTGAVAPAALGRLTRGARVTALLEGVATTGRVESIVPAPTGGMQSVAVIVENAGRQHRSGSTATIVVPQGMRQALLVPLAALRHQGELVGVEVDGAGSEALRWVTVGDTIGDLVELRSGVRAGERVRLLQTPPE